MDLTYMVQSVFLAVVTVTVGMQSNKVDIPSLTVHPLNRRVGA